MTGGQIEGNKESRTWESSDKLKTYKLEFESSDQAAETSTAISGTVIRELCSAVIPPFPITAVPACRMFRRSFPNSRSRFRQVAQSVMAGKETWRMDPAPAAARNALEKATATWAVQLAPELGSPKCENPMILEHDQFTSCSWDHPEGLQEFAVGLIRSAMLLSHGREWSSVPWTETAVSGVACEVQ